MQASPISHSASEDTSSIQDLKVLQVGKFYPPHMGGIETHLQVLCGELQKVLKLSVVVANDGSSRVDQILDGVSVMRLGTSLTLFSTPLCPAMAGAIGGSNADIIHIHLPNPAAVMAYLVSGHRGRLVVTYHSDTVKQKILGALFEPFLHAALRRASAIIVTSPDYLRTSPVLREYRERCHVIPYGIAVGRFDRSDSSDVAQLRRQYGDDRLVLSVGRLVYYKGFEHLIYAMRSVRGKLLLIGDGPLRGGLEKLVSVLGLSDRVIFAGEIQNDQLVPYYHASSVFVLASIARSEAFGIVQIEAMASGIPVVNTRLDSGVPFVSIHGQTGLTVAPGDSGALAAAINRLLDHEDLRVSYGRSGRARAEGEFSLPVMTSRVLQLYEKVMLQPAGKPVMRAV